MELNYQQQAAIKGFLDQITSSIGMMKWDKEKLFSVFKDYGIDTSIELSYSDYVRTLKRLPFKVKRDFICKILNCWSYAGHSDYYTLYQTLQDLLYLKIETGVECVLFNNLLNLSHYLGISNFYIDATAETDYYMIDVYFDCDDVDHSDRQVRFTTSSEDEQPRVEFSVYAPLLRKKMQFTAQPSQEDVSNLLNTLKENHTKKHCPWIYLDYSLRCGYMGGLFAAFLQVKYENIQYIDNNGEYMTDLEKLFETRKIAKQNQDLQTLANCAFQMAKEFNFDDVRSEAAYFYGRLHDFEGFSEMLQNAKARAMNYDEMHRSYQEERHFFNIGLEYPDLDDFELDFLEEKYMSSGSYEMMDRILFDKERLDRTLNHFNPDEFEIKNTDFSDELLDKVFRATWKNEFDLDVQEAIDNRYTAKTQNETWRGAFGLGEYDPSDEPIYVYNRRTNDVELDRSMLDDVLLTPLYHIGKMGDVVEEYGNLFGSEVRQYIIDEVLPATHLSYGWETAIFSCYWYRQINVSVMKKFNVIKDDPRLNQVRRNLAKKWLIELNNKPLR